MASPDTAPPEVVPVATHRERRGSDRTAEVEGEDPGAAVTPELQCHQREQHALAGAGRTDHEGARGYFLSEGAEQEGKTSV
jgi:hypothetical protein